MVLRMQRQSATDYYNQITKDQLTFETDRRQIHQDLNARSEITKEEITELRWMLKRGMVDVCLYVYEQNFFLNNV